MLFIAHWLNSSSIRLVFDSIFSQQSLQSLALGLNYMELVAQHQLSIFLVLDGYHASKRDRLHVDGYGSVLLLDEFVVDVFAECKVCHLSISPKLGC